MGVDSTGCQSVLVVEDDSIAARSLVYLLQHYGYRVRAVGSVQEAIAHLQPTPDIILLDLHLPDGHGTAVMEALMQRNLTSRVAVITASLDHALLGRARLLGPEMILKKPLDFLGLLEQLRAKSA